MKKQLFVILILTLLGLELRAQNTQDQDVVYGSVRLDGFSKITKGAFWSKRPEAKMVYQGEYPEGVEVIILESNYFVRFVESEHNNFDRNYIVFPKGQRIYKKDGRYFAAICGNEIEFFQPVDRTRVVGNIGEKNNQLEKREEKKPFFEIKANEQKPVFSPDAPNTPKVPFKKKNRWLKPVIITVGTAIVAGVIYYFLKKKGGKPIETGRPGGAPPTSG